ncbi:MAG: outer membrane lipoprotein carrier protein LolA [Sneathiella sp.]
MLNVTRFFRYSLLTSLLLGSVVASAAPLTTSDKQDIQRVETYLNGISSLKAKFLQVNSEGQIAEGDVYMRRPGRMRIEYQPPAQILVVADGTWLVLHDKELEETNRLPLYSTPVSVLLKENVRLEGDVTVVSVEKEGNTLRLNIIDSEEPDEGGITLVFEDKPLKLRKWLVTDAQGNTTSVALSDMERGLELKAELFTFFDPSYD